MHLAFLTGERTPPPIGGTDAVAVSRRAFELFLAAVRHWHLDLERQARLLNASVSTLQRLRRSLHGGDHFAAFDPDRLLRLSLVANIARDLELSLGQGDDLRWLQAPNADLDQRRPLDVMVEDGLPGLSRVYVELRDWTLGR